jgi:hypothetical protein
MTARLNLGAETSVRAGTHGNSPVLEYVEVILAEEGKARGSASKPAGGNSRGCSEIVMIEVPAWI